MELPQTKPRPTGYSDEVMLMDVKALEVLAKRDVSSKLRLEYALEILFLRARLREISCTAIEGVAPKIEPPKGSSIRRVK